MQLFEAVVIFVVEFEDVFVAEELVYRFELDCEVEVGVDLKTAAFVGATKVEVVVAVEVAEAFVTVAGFVFGDVEVVVAVDCDAVVGYD